MKRLKSVFAYASLISILLTISSCGNDISDDVDVPQIESKKFRLDDGRIGSYAKLFSHGSCAVYSVKTPSRNDVITVCPR